VLWSAVTPRSIKSQDLDCGRRFITEDLVLRAERATAFEFVTKVPSAISKFRRPILQQSLEAAFQPSDKINAGSQP